jgi:hypothetical protein
MVRFLSDDMPGPRRRRQDGRDFALDLEERPIERLLAGFCSTL